MIVDSYTSLNSALRGIFFPILLFAAFSAYSATYEDIQRFNSSLKPGNKIECKVSWESNSDAGRVTVERTTRSKLVSRSENSRVFATDEIFSQPGDKTPNLIIQYRVTATTDETGETRRIDASTINVIALSSPELADIVANQFKRTLTAYQANSMITFTNFPDFSIQGAPDWPVTYCVVLNSGDGKVKHTIP
ncbi:hypothetical protein F3J28_20070 [Enterobacter sp. Ap-1006]|uniref:hypothetical protein n=1 Tax=Enterobacter sp. Ap-1006 TaxID=2608345 RepID=UPI001421F909|nr:hypothetical protein [Enterobacter sp. Ap-1006]NIF50060.1 hypothetical protein [Enterobacter sp. Ap-1006]